MGDVRQLRRTCTCHANSPTSHPPRVYRDGWGRWWVSPLPVTWAPYKELLRLSAPTHLVALAATLVANRGRVPQR